MIKENEKDTRISRLVTDARIVRKLLKLNGEFKYCPCCGKELTSNCGCHKNLVIDTKPNKSNPDKSVFIFKNTDEFKADLDEIISYFAEKEAKQDEISE